MNNSQKVIFAVFIIFIALCIVRIFSNYEEYVLIQNILLLLYNNRSTMSASYKLHSVQ